MTLTLLQALLLALAIFLAGGFCGIVAMALAVANRHAGRGHG